MVNYQNQYAEYDQDKRKLLSSLSHGAIFISTLWISVLVPLGILLVSDDPVVKENARESLNFHFNIWLYELIFGFLTIILIGYPLLGIVVLLSWILPILAIIKIFANPNESYRYSFIFRLL
ncbi:MAG: DUF4870 domain-containing protein [Symploca sp. SIO1A3]|nr:DUF4870 domain-containing protein [Symploca sp. SIO2C1]NER51276.1 DUF4870 domain-containing protein [Symploca sp. SIO1A3]